MLSSRVKIKLVFVSYLLLSINPKKIRGRFLIMAKKAQANAKPASAKPANKTSGKVTAKAASPVAAKKTAKATASAKSAPKAAVPQASPKAAAKKPVIPPAKKTVTPAVLESSKKP